MCLVPVRNITLNRLWSCTFQSSGSQMISVSFISNMESESERVVCFVGIYSCAANSDSFFLNAPFDTASKTKLVCWRGGGSLCVYVVNAVKPGR